MGWIEDNFKRHIEDNPYPGRGLAIGRSSEDYTWIQVYWIMGRSDHSRNRRFVSNEGALRTEPVDSGLVEDPSLIIYDAMADLNGIYLVTNGDQTTTIVEHLNTGRSFDEALSTREREPDAPNYTPRISGMLNLRQDEPAITLSILKANPVDPQDTDATTFRPSRPGPGLGLCLTTYMGDGSPLPPYTGDPLILPCEGSPADILDSYWNALDPANRISLAVKQIDPLTQTSSILVRNRYGDV
jgi:IMP cyclohydrolase